LPSARSLYWPFRSSCDSPRDDAILPLRRVLCDTYVTRLTSDRQ
ncbi:unnamed protein product, partial [Callosobruchus maculatus]